MEVEQEPGFARPAIFDIAKNLDFFGARREAECDEPCKADECRASAWHKGSHRLDSLRDQRRAHAARRPTPLMMSLPHGASSGNSPDHGVIFSTSWEGTSSWMLPSFL